MKTLTIFYDGRCGLCASFRGWLDARPKYVATEFLAYDSAEARRRFPALEKNGAAKEIIVLADDGRWWQGDAAWLTCLWVTREFRPWSQRLAAPLLRPLIKKAVHLLSENRLTLSRLLHLKHDAQLAASLDAMPAPAALANPTCNLNPSNP